MDLERLQKLKVSAEVDILSPTSVLWLHFGSPSALSYQIYGFYLNGEYRSVQFRNPSAAFVSSPEKKSPCHVESMWFGPTALDSLQHFLFHHLILANLGFIGLKLQSGTSLEMFFVAGKMESDCNNHDETLPGYNFLHSQRHLFIGLLSSRNYPK